MRSLSEFDPAWPHGHVQKTGLPVRILGEIKADDYPLIVAVPSDCGARETVTHYTADGRLWNNGQTSLHDLINAPAPKRRVQGWVNLWAHNARGFEVGAVFATKALALAAAGFIGHRLACIYIDVEEGEGLS